MSRKLTQKQKNFCHKYVELGNATDAFLESYDSNPSNRQVARNQAYLLLQKEHVQDYVDEVREQHRKRHNITVDDILAEFEANRKLAFSTENAAAANGATMGKAKVLGLDKQVVELSAKDKKPVINISLSED